MEEKNIPDKSQVMAIAKRIRAGHISVFPVQKKIVFTLTSISDRAAIDTLGAYYSTGLFNFEKGRVIENKYLLPYL